MKRFCSDLPCDYKNLSPQTLAFLGDCIFEMFVREKLICQYPFCQTRKLHESTVQKVCCQSQAKFMKTILHLLTDEELKIYKRGYNAHTVHTPKGATHAQYHEATALECLLGYLYLKGDMQRLRTLLANVLEPP